MAARGDQDGSKASIRVRWDGAIPRGIRAV
jgi:hypothetical protein